MNINDKEKIFKALGDKNRLMIMDLISKDELSAGKILEQVNMGQSTLSHHMKILCDSGIVNARKDSRWVYYTINAEVAAEISSIISEWIR
ncbi:MAG: winged helix-turn-helix transcriptional regulator [Oscillospiraceae bacterium]|nr:winged helix-turn-helix transcriptional regulator [Oscillospiraceae bacterium]